MKIIVLFVICFSLCLDIGNMCGMSFEQAQEINSVMHHPLYESNLQARQVMEETVLKLLTREQRRNYIAEKNVIVANERAARKQMDTLAEQCKEYPDNRELWDEYVEGARILMKFHQQQIDLCKTLRKMPKKKHCIIS